MKTMIALSIVLTVLVSAHAGPDVAPDLRHDGRETYVGVRFAWRFGGPATARPARVARTRYVEEWAVTASAGEIDAAPVPVIDRREEPIEAGFVERAADHFRRNAGKYVAGTVVTAAAAGLYAIGEQNGWWDGDGGGNDDSKPPAVHSPQRSPTAVVVAGDGSPVNVAITIQETAE